MGILFLRVKYFYAAVHMLSGYINALFIQEIEQHGLPYRSQIPGNDLVVIVRLPSEILQVLFDGGSRGRGHAGTHIHAVLQAVIHDFTGSQSGDFGPGFSVFGSGKHKSAASGHGPSGGKRALVAVAQRKAEFLLRTGKMAACHTGRFLRKTSAYHERGQGQGKPAGGAGSIQAEQRDFKADQAEAGRYFLA